MPNKVVRTVPAVLHLISVFIQMHVLFVPMTYILLQVYTNLAWLKFAKKHNCFYNLSLCDFAALISINLGKPYHKLSRYYTVLINHTHVCSARQINHFNSPLYEHAQRQISHAMHLEKCIFMCRRLSMHFGRIFTVVPVYRIQLWYTSTSTLQL